MGRNENVQKLGQQVMGMVMVMVVMMMLMMMLMMISMMTSVGISGIVPEQQIRDTRGTR